MYNKMTPIEASMNCCWIRYIILYITLYPIEGFWRF